MPDMLKTEIVIKLDAANCRLRDQIVSMKITETKLLKQKHTFTPTSQRHPFYEGFTGELAFAKWLHVPYKYKPYDKQDADVMGYQIKTTQRPDGCLIKQAHMPTGVYVLGIVNAALDTVTFKGWALTHEIEQEAYWRTDVPKPAYFVPQSELWSMSELTSTKELAAYHGWV